MSDKPDNPFKFWEELKRRKVVRVITVYAAASFVILELVSIVAPSLGLPSWTLNMVIVLLCIGFIISTILSWVYDITPEGIQKTKSSKQGRSEAKQITSRGWKISTYISALVIIGFAGFYIIGNFKQSSDISKLEKSIAVLPFDNESSDEENEYFVNGMMEDIRNNLSIIGDLHVLSKTSAEKYRNSNQALKEIAEELGVNYLLEGTVQKQGNQVKIHAQLIEAAEDDHIWVQTYLRDISEIFKVQSEVAQTIAKELKAILSPEEIEQINKQPTDNIEAYDLYLKGISIFEGRGDGLTNEAIFWFKESIKLDSSFALPWTYLSMCYWRLAANADAPEFHKAKRSLERALELNPTSGTAIVNMAEIMDNEYDFEGAEEKIKLALKIDPDNPYVLRNAGRFYTLIGRQDMSISFCNLALQDDPINQTALLYLTRAYFYAGNFIEARAALTKFSELEYIGNANLYYQLILEEGNIEKIVKDPSFQNDDNARDVALAAFYFKSGDNNEAEKICEDLKERKILNYNYWIAFAYTYGDNPEEVYRWLERSFAAKEKFLTYLGVDPAFNKFRNEPRVKSLLQEMKFPI